MTAAMSWLGHLHCAFPELYVCLIFTQVNKGQEALDKKLGMLETHQKDIHDALVGIENEASRLYLARVLRLSFRILRI